MLTGGRQVVLPEPHPSTTVSWIVPVEAMGRASVETSARWRQEQSEGQRGGVWHPLTITINSI